MKCAASEHKKKIAVRKKLAIPRCPFWSANRKVDSLGVAAPHKLQEECRPAQMWTVHRQDGPKHLGRCCKLSHLCMACRFHRAAYGRQSRNSSPPTTASACDRPRKQVFRQLCLRATGIGPQQMGQMGPTATGLQLPAYSCRPTAAGLQLPSYSCRPTAAVLQGLAHAAAFSAGAAAV